VPGKRERVEDVPEVDHEHSDRDRGERRGAGDHTDQQQLERPGERRQRQRWGNPPRQAKLDHQQTQRDTEWKDAEPGRERVGHTCDDLGTATLRDHAGFVCCRELGRFRHADMVADFSSHVVAKVARSGLL
jgi:hypothetical protein